MPSAPHTKSLLLAGSTHTVVLSVSRVLSYQPCSVVSVISWTQVFYEREKKAALCCDHSFSQAGAVCGDPTTTITTTPTTTITTTSSPDCLLHFGRMSRLGVRQHSHDYQVSNHICCHRDAGYVCFSMFSLSSFIAMAHRLKRNVAVRPSVSL